MTARRRAATRRLGLWLGSLGLAATAHAQEQVSIVLDHDNPGRQITGYVDAVYGSRRPGGYGYAIVQLTNADRAPHSIALSLHTRQYSRWSFSANQVLALEPGQQARAVLPLLSGNTYGGVLGIDAEDGGKGWYSNLSLSADRTGLAALCIADRSETRQAWENRLETISMAELSGKVRLLKKGLAVFQSRAAADLPDRWQWLTAFDVVVVDGTSRGMTAERQQLLCDLLEGGGRLLVVEPGALAAGPLHEATDLGGQSERNGTLGFGHWLAFAAASSSDETTRAWLCGKLASGSGGNLFDRVVRGQTGTLPGNLGMSMQIPGVGEVPVRAFFVLILLFAVLVGPINHFIAHRKRKPMLMLITVPAAGIGFTVVLLLYGVLSEGLDTKGVVRSLSLLDQRRHEAVTTTARTLFAGLSPAWLQPGPRTYLYCSNLRSGYRAMITHSLDIDLSRGRVRGTLLPSRTPTTLISVSQSPCRERIRFRRLPEGGLALLAGPALRPMDGGGTVLLCDRDGRYYLNESDGRMRACDPTTASKFVDDAANDCSEFRIEARSPGASRGPARTTGVLAAHLAEAMQPRPMSYVARVQNNPAADNLGLSVEWKGHAHFVRGLLAEEDFVE